MLHQQQPAEPICMPPHPPTYALVRNRAAKIIAAADTARTGKLVCELSAPDEHEAVTELIPSCCTVQANGSYSVLGEPAQLALLKKFVDEPVALHVKLALPAVPEKHVFGVPVAKVVTGPVHVVPAYVSCTLEEGGVAVPDTQVRDPYVTKPLVGVLEEQPAPEKGPWLPVDVPVQVAPANRV